MAQALDYGKIKDSCSNLTKLAGNVGTTVDNMNSAIKKIAEPAWVGKASEAYRDKINTLASHLPEANRQLAEAIIFLASCADAYDQLDKDAVKKLKDLIGGQEYIDKYDVDKAPSINLDSRYGEETPSETPSAKEPKKTGCSSSGCSSSGCSSRGCGGCGGGKSQPIRYSVGPTTPKTTPETVPETTPTVETPIELTDKLKKVDYMSIELQDANEHTKSLFENKNFKYKDAFAMIDDYYLISCDKSIGTIGDVIKITLKNGKIITCIVAANTSDKETIKFIVEKDKETDASKKEPLKLEDVEKIENIGDCKKNLDIVYYDLYGDSVANKALELACSAIGTNYLTLEDAKKVGCDLSKDGRLHVPDVANSHNYRADLPQTEKLLKFWDEEKATGEYGLGTYGPASCSPWIGSVLRSMGYDSKIGTKEASLEGLISPWTGEKITNSISAHGEATYMYHRKETFEEIKVDPNKTIAEQCKPGDIIGGPSHIMIYVGNDWAKKYFPGTTGNVVEAAEHGHCYPGVTNAGSGKVGSYKIFRVKNQTTIE